VRYFSFNDDDLKYKRWNKETFRAYLRVLYEIRVYFRCIRKLLWLWIHLKSHFVRQRKSASFMTDRT